MDSCARIITVDDKYFGILRWHNKDKPDIMIPSDALACLPLEVAEACINEFKIIQTLEKLYFERGDTIYTIHKHKWTQWHVSNTSFVLKGVKLDSDGTVWLWDSEELTIITGYNNGAPAKDCFKSMKEAEANCRIRNNLKDESECTCDRAIEDVGLCPLHGPDFKKCSQNLEI